MKANKPLSRASVACRECNKRRVRCDAFSQGLPCTNCKNKNHHCELIQSRRGHHRRYRPSQSLDITPQLLNRVIAADDRPETAKREEGDNDDGMYFAELLTMPRETITLAKTVSFASEGWSLTPVIKAVNANSNTPLHFCMSPHQTKTTTNEGPTAHAAKEIQLAYLRCKNVFWLPERGNLTKMIELYFRICDPWYPIIDKDEFFEKYNNKETISPLLLQSMLFMTSTHCDEAFLRSIGFRDRYSAQNTFAERVKALLDADIEQDRIIVIVSLYLYAFWWKSPADLKDTRTYLSVAISLAQAIGMHRS